MALMNTGAPTAALGNVSSKGGRNEAPRPTPNAEPPKKVADQLAASLQAKESSRTVTVDEPKRVGGTKAPEEQRFDRSPEKGIDRVSISGAAIAAAKSVKPQAAPKNTALDSGVRPTVDGAPGRFAQLPRVEAEDPTRAGRDAAVLSKASQPGTDAPADLSKTLYSPN
jgi:hypothetical protein